MTTLEQVENPERGHQKPNITNFKYGSILELLLSNKPSERSLDGETQIFNSSSAHPGGRKLAGRCGKRPVR